MQDTIISQLLSFNDEIKDGASQEKFLEVTRQLSEQMPISPEMDDQQKRVVLASRIKHLTDNNMLTYDFTMTLMKTVSEKPIEYLEEYMCF